MFEQAIVQAGSVISESSIKTDAELNIMPGGKQVSLGSKVIVLKDGDTAFPLSLNGIPLTVDEPHSIQDGSRMA